MTLTPAAAQSAAIRRVLILSRGTDAAGTGMALKTAFDHCAPDWEARAVRRKNAWFDYACDIEWRKGDARTGRLVADLFARADVIHVMQAPQIVKLFPRWQSKAIVVQHIGSYFRDNPAAVSEACRAVGAVEAAGSHELLRLAPAGTELLVGTYDLDSYAAIRERVYRRSERVRIVHAPTNREIKSTATFLAATERLARRYPIDVDLIERVPWRECIERKAQADILFDQTELGYGLNAVEAWGMGMPVVCGLANPEARRMFTSKFGPFPFVDATEATIEPALEMLITSAEARQQWGQTGRAFADEQHSEREVVAKAIAIYERALNR